ncbi:electron transport complex subunit E [Glaciecola sp. 2405UD65-10]|uniref:electron transport complex subunit E n=1 Tax=Glaciecola sp. 2405UD65-10 TaxID=3397244 RepID=UPI003B5C64E0
MSNEYNNLAHQGLWKNNPAIVQLLGLCPLLAVSGTFINALGLGIATTIVLLGSNITVSLVKNFVPNEIRIPIFVMVIASFVTLIELLMHAYTFELYQVLGIFIPLIVTNCAIIGRAEAYASKNPVQFAAFDGLMMGLGFTFILVLLGGMREVLGLGTLFSGADLLFGDWAKNLTIEVYKTDANFLLAILPPGAFIGMGLIIAAKNLIDAAIAKRQEKNTNKVVQRARVTGTDI